MRIATLLLLVVLAVPALAQEAYVSPYWLKFSLAPERLTADFSQSPRDSVEQESFSPPFRHWYEKEAYPRGQESWGPLSRRYPEPQIPSGVDPTVWRRERLLAVAQRYIGYDYQHHHVPDWQPPADWPSTTPERSKGVDCSNFTSWLYNYGLGMKFTADVREQSELDGERLLQVRGAEPQDYETMRRILKTGDLLFIRGNKRFAPGSGITHVIMWVGDVGQPADEPLVVDSHGDSVKDSRGNDIPAGVHLRPFRRGSWYHEAFDHALRLVR